MRGGERERTGQLLKEFPFIVLLPSKKQTETAVVSHSSLFLDFVVASPQIWQHPRMRCHLFLQSMCVVEKRGEKNFFNEVVLVTLGPNTNFPLFHKFSWTLECTFIFRPLWKSLAAPRTASLDSRPCALINLGTS